MRTYAHLHECLLSELGDCITARVTFEQSVFLKKLEKIVAGSEPDLQAKVLLREISSYKSEISRHFPSASSSIVFREVRRSFLVRAYEFLHKHLLAKQDHSVVVSVMI